MLCVKFVCVKLVGSGDCEEGEVAGLQTKLYEVSGNTVVIPS